MIKKSILLVAASVAVAGAANAAPSHITKESDGAYRVTYDYKDKEKSGWYIGARAELSFLNWKNEYSTDNPADESADSDKYSFEPVFGGNLAAGYRFNYFWRAEVEGGFLGYYTDKDDGFEFNLSIPYLMANGYYDFSNGLYLGAGLGVAMPKTTLDAEDFVDGDREKWGLSGMGALMLGYSHKLDESLVLDLRYRLAGMTGVKQSRTLDNGDKFENKIGFIMDNSISVGLRYEF